MEGGSMDPNITTKRAKIFAKVAATLVGALGLYLIGAMLLSIWRMFYSYDSIWEIIFPLVFMAITSAAGVTFGVYIIIAQRFYPSFRSLE